MKLALVGANIIGDVGDYGPSTVSGLIGDLSNPIDSKLAPLGGYVGPTHDGPLSRTSCPRCCRFLDSRS